MRHFAILLSLTLMGCAVTRAPVGNESVTSHLEGGVLVTRDGTRLPLREWDAEGAKPQAVIIGLHGMSDYSNAFDMPGKVWAGLGITTVAFDQRGFGRGDNPGNENGQNQSKSLVHRGLSISACASASAALIDFSLGFAPVKSMSTPTLAT